ncbi:MAG: TonB-dependent receptor [Flavobacteriaceae bacterium]|nr:TonB-dependent receptor [Flavobacteriaceae bacterium]
MKKSVLWAIGLCVASVGIAQETVKFESLDSVYIDTKVPLARKNSGKVVVSITSEELQQSVGKSVATIINEVSGIEINGSRSNAGQNLGYFVRGGRNRQVVVMVDGVQLNDPSSIGNDFDLRLLSTSNIESIEIVKGASSVLYGSGGATAVINITTKKASKKDISASFTTILGSNRASGDGHNDVENFTNSANVSGTLGEFKYAVDFGHRSSKGLSAVAAPEGEANLVEDNFDRLNTTVNLGYEISKNVSISRFFSLDDFTTEFDDFSYKGAENVTYSEQKRVGGNLTWKYNKGRFVLNDNHSWLDRETESSFSSQFDAKSSTFDAFGSYRVDEKLTILAGVNANFSRFNSFSIPFGSNEFMKDVDAEIANFSIIDPYVNATYISDFGLNVSAGARLNNHSDYGSHVVYNVNPSYGFSFGKNHLKILASYSTAYITPSLFQLHDTLYGNLELQPEENATIEGGLEFTIGKELRVSAVYFNRDETNFVDFVSVDPINFISQYQNIETEFKASGFEVELFKKFGKNVTFSANYTNTQADENFILRIPEHKANARLGYTLGIKTKFGVSYNYTSERQDSFFNPNTFESEMVTLESFGLLNFNASHQISKNVQVFGGLSNILDEEYEELYRFQTRGRNFQLGLKLDF